MRVDNLEVPLGWQESIIGESCEIHNNLREPISQIERQELQGDYPYYGPTGILDYLDHYRVDGKYALIGEDGDHFLKFDDRKMTVNGTGAFSSVIEAIDLNTLSFAAIIEQFGNLPATSQAALVMAVLSAFIIPIGALVAGDGLAALALERRTTTDTKEEAWQEVEFTVVYRALFGRYLQQGLPERDAR